MHTYGMSFSVGHHFAKGGIQGHMLPQSFTSHVINASPAIGDTALYPHVQERPCSMCNSLFNSALPCVETCPQNINSQSIADADSACHGQ